MHRLAFKELEHHALGGNEHLRHFFSFNVSPSLIDAKWHDDSLDEDCNLVILQFSHAQPLGIPDAN